MRRGRPASGLKLTHEFAGHSTFRDNERLSNEPMEFPSFFYQTSSFSSQYALTFSNR